MVARFFRDSKGRSRYVLMQEFATSCGPASVAMTEDYYKQSCMLDPEGRARQLSQKYPGNWSLAGGTNVTNLSSVLNAEGVKAYRAINVTPAAVFAYLWFYAKELTPVIVHIAWTPSGGHFVVCPQVDSDQTAIFLDPWYGLVEVARANMPSYSPTGASGQFSGWIVITYR